MRLPSKILLLLVTALAAAAGSANASAASNANSSKLCHSNDLASLFRSDGTTFKNAGACTSYGAKGGSFTQLKMEAVTLLIGPDPCICFRLTGFGLLPGSTVTGSIFISGTFFGGGSFDVGSNGMILEPVAYFGLICRPSDPPLPVSAVATGFTSAGAPITTPKISVIDDC